MNSNMKDNNKDRKFPKGNKFKKGSTHNDVSWYKRNKSLFDQSTNLSLLRVYGDYPWLDLHYDETIERDITKINPEHILNFYYSASLGECATSSSPINRAALQVYNIIRGQYTNTVNFQANDIACYFGSIGSVLSLISHIRKLFELSTFNNTDNAYTAKYIIDGIQDSLGTYQDIIDNKGDYLQKFQTIVDRLQALAVPSDMPYFDKCLWLGRYVYTESYSKEYASTLFTMSPKYLLQWNSSSPTTNGEITASGLDLISVDNNNMSDLLSILSSMIDALVDDDNVRNISVWISKYIPHFAYVKDLVSIDYIIPERSDLFISQLRNSVVLSSFDTLRKAHVYIQDVDNQILVEQVRTLTETNLKVDTFEFYLPDANLNTFKTPTADDVMEFTRFRPCFKMSSAVGTSGKKITYIGDTAYIARITVISKNRFSSTYTVNDVITYFSDGGLTSLDVYDILIQLSICISSPILPQIFILNAPLSTEEQDYIVTNWYPVLYEGYNNVLSNKVLENLHYTAVISQFDASYLSFNK